MKLMTTILATGLVLGLAGCGGGSSSSGGGGSGGATAYAGSYGGTYNLSVAGPGGNFGGTGPITMVVNSDGSMLKLADIHSAGLMQSRATAKPSNGYPHT